MLDRARRQFEQLKPMLGERLGEKLSDKLSENKWRSSHGHSGSRFPLNSRLTENTIRLLSFNIQAGLNSKAYKDYITTSVSQFMPTPPDLLNLNEIGSLLSDYDVVALQEVDGGSLRSGYINQLAHFAEQGGFPYWHQQLNRDFGRLGQYSNGLLSRIIPYSIEDHRLPGVRGRGAIVTRYGNPESPLIVIGLHLALGEKGRYRQLEYVKELIRPYQHVIIMGDMNCCADSLIDTPLRDTNLRPAATSTNTYPSWAPTRTIDHILVTPNLKVNAVNVLNCQLSDHCPVAIEVTLPESVISTS